MSVTEFLDRRLRRAPWRLVLELLALVAGLGTVQWLVGRQYGRILDPHPSWIAVLVLAARYGGAGLLAGLIGASVAFAIVTSRMGTPFAAAWSAFGSGPNLIAFATCLAVSAVASWHLR